MKLWESAVDLARFLLDRFCDGGRTGGGMAGMRVLELGCGHGLPGIVCALAGAHVTFQVQRREVAMGTLVAQNVT